MMPEFSATEIRLILQKLFPDRRLVLSQFTFFNHSGVSRPTGNSFRRGRRCYRMQDLLSIACVLALKEEGIPLKNIDAVPALLQDNAEEIFSSRQPYTLSGTGSTVSLVSGGVQGANVALQEYLEGASPSSFFWSFDLGLLANQLMSVTQGFVESISSENLAVA